ncbi:MAG TPA: hypothetical protein VJ963_08475, partial [Bacteroidales bacterium]|nr:hypothetical protein [Bacteroidales bacterium]
RRYGFILACSNNSRNGPMQNNLDAAAAVLRDIQERFIVDGRRIYVAGFSGGSRFAMTLAVMDGKISGVIGCGAGLPNDRNFFPQENAGFFYFGIVGSRDMNYQEMLALPDFFSNRSHVISYIRTFPGGHQWPSSKLVTEAVEWLVMKSMDRKIIPDDPLFRSYLENKTKKLIDGNISSGNLVGAVRYMTFAERDFRGSPFGSHMEVLLGKYQNSSEYKKAIRARNRIMSDESGSRQKYMNYLGEILKSQVVPDSAFAWWKNEVSTLTELRDKGNADKSAMAYRILNFISILCWEEGTNVYSYRLYAHAAFLFGICTMSDSENPNTWYYLARSLAKEGKTTKAVDALYSAVKHDLKSREKIESDPAFDSIRGNTRYKALIGKMR